ncbi:Sialic acid TRAP transporter permease protein SiaT [subsurface metagenome]
MDVGLSFGIVLVLIFLFIIAGLPLSYIFGFAALLILAMVGTVDFRMIMPSAMKLLLAHALLALPLYILVGTLMSAGVISSRLVGWINALLGEGKSVLGATGVLFSTVFGAISGSGLSAVAAVGKILIPQSEQYGYDREYMTGVIACSSLLAMLIPPSLPMIVFGVTAEINVATCFLAGAVPGLIIALLPSCLPMRHQPSDRTLLPIHLSPETHMEAVASNHPHQHLRHILLALLPLLC